MPRLSPRRTAAALALLSAAIIAREFRTPVPVPASAPPTEFSAERALTHVQTIAARPHPMGSAAHTAVREYIMRTLTAMGLEPELQTTTGVGTRYQAAGRVVNIVARMKGQSPSAHALVIAAHYDGVAAAPAAGDDASGSAALLETLRALRAGPPLTHDVIVLFTDGEEAGLLGAAAFVREHRWAKEADLFLNFEARGTEGRSTMFETGPGNLDVAREIAKLPDVSAGSLMVTVYRNLPNDTDLSEFSLLGRPALNFAFIGGVVRYHTAHDDVAHLSLGSLQHHGMQMLALTRAFGQGPLPRTVTPDAVFFTTPVLGVVVYPEPYANAFAVLTVLLVLVVVWGYARRETTWIGGAVMGLASVLAVAALCGWGANAIAQLVNTWHDRNGWDGNPDWRGIYAVALALLSLTVASAAWVLVRRWCSARALYAGVLVLWAIFTGLLTLKLPGVSYLTVWPLLAFAIAEQVSLWKPDSIAAESTRWLATLVLLAVMLPLLATVGGYALPLAGPGGIAIGVLVPLVAWMLAPQLDVMRGERPWGWPSLCGIAAVLCVAGGMLSVRRSAESPERANLTYAMHADQDSALLITRRDVLRPSRWPHALFGDSVAKLVSPLRDSVAYGWLGDSPSLAVRRLPRVSFGALDASLRSDSSSGAERHVTVRVVAPSGALLVGVRGPAGARVVSVDGVPATATRYRHSQSSLGISYSAPSDSGFVLGIVLPNGAPLWLALSALSAGLPELPGLVVPPRPADVVPSQNGDVTLRYRRVVLPKL